MKVSGQVPSNCLGVGEDRWSGPNRTASVPDSSATLSQCLLTAPLHCLPVSPDSPATLSPGQCVTLLLPTLLASASFCRVVGRGVEGKQVESMDEEPQVRKQVESLDEEPQVRGCYNISFICTPTNQETVSVLEKTQANKTFRT